MTPAADTGTARDFWQFFRGYVDTPIHAVSAAALAIFGILVFVDPLFALLAIGSYVLPPIVLFSIGWRKPSDRAFEPDENSVERARRSRTGAADTGTRPDRVWSSAEAADPIDADADSDGGDGDTDTDSDDGDTDTDSDDGDTDSDSDDGDTDSDTDS